MTQSYTNYSSSRPKNTTIIVISSTTFSSSNQRFHATADNRSTASYSSYHHSLKPTSGCSQSSIN